jgi:polyphenol oxidase
LIRFSFLENLGVGVAAISDVSDGDCGFRSADPAARTRLCESCDIYVADLVCARQVHGNSVARAREEDRGREFFPETDGIVTDVASLPLVVAVADCVPVFVYDPVKQAVGIIHAGREGTLKNIVGAGVNTMRSSFGSEPRDLYAVIGPSAGPCCYEVDEAMTAACEARGVARRGRCLDLWQTNAIQLAAAGVSIGNIEITGICTICDGRFFSYRRGDGIARNMALIML